MPVALANVTVTNKLAVQVALFMGQDLVATLPAGQSLPLTATFAEVGMFNGPVPNAHVETQPAAHAFGPGGSAVIQSGDAVDFVYTPTTGASTTVRFT
jgi:hypothetical protein